MGGNGPTQNGSPHRDPAGNLSGDQGARKGVQNGTIDLHSGIDRTGVHEPLMGLEPGGPFNGQAVGTTVIGGNEAADPSFALDPKHHDHVDTGKHLIKVVGDRGPPVGSDSFEALINHSRRTHQRDVRTHRLQTVQIRSCHPAVGDVNEMSLSWP